MEEWSPKISVIVAVYKAEKYIRKCLDSLLQQTFRDFEILLIDDGSPDCSGDICDRYAEMNSHVKVFHKLNGGVSSARQYGIENAKGEYIIYVDPDDWVEVNMLEELYDKAKNENADIVICDFYINQDGSQKYVKQQPSSLIPKNIICELFQLLLHGSCWNKLVKRVCYNKVSFPKDINYSEDLIVCIRLLKNMPTVVYLNRAFYHYQYGINENSLAKIINRTALEQDMRVYHTLKEECNNDLVLVNALQKGVLIDLIVRAFISGLLSSKEFKMIYGKYRKNIFLDKRHNIYKKIVCYISCLGYSRELYNLYKIYRVLRYSIQ